MKKHKISVLLAICDGKPLATLGPVLNAERVFSSLAEFNPIRLNSAHDL